MFNGKMKAVIDEDLPRSVGAVLSELGWEVKDVRDTYLRGKSDKLVIDFTRRNGAMLFSGDWGFANILNFPPRDYHGIILISFPNEVPAVFMVSEFKRMFVKLEANDLRRNLVIIEPGRIRIRRGI